MNKKILKLILMRSLIVFVGINLILIAISFFVKLGSSVSNGENIFPSSLSLLSFDETKYHQRIEIEEVASNLESNEDYGSVYHFNQGNQLTFKVNVLESKDYVIAIDYYSLQTTVQNISIDVIIDEEIKEERQNIQIQTAWQDESREQVFDIYQNQVISTQVAYHLWNKAYLYDQRFYQSTPLVFQLTKGQHEITIKNKRGEFLLGDIFLIENTPQKDYASISQNGQDTSGQKIVLEGESPLYKSTPEIRATSVSEAHLSPFSTEKSLLNVLSGDNFNQSGNQVTYAFNVKQAGNYQISFKYANTQENTYSYANILIDNVSPFSQMQRYGFQSTNGYRNETLHHQDGNYSFYFSEGMHTITIAIDASNQAPIYYKMNDIIQEINALYLEIVKLTGGDSDPNKSWNIDAYIPTARTRLNKWKSELQELLLLANEVSKVNPKKQNRLYQQIENAYDKIDSLSKNPNKLPHKLTILSQGSSSASKILSNALHTSTFSPLTIDQIFIHSKDVKLPKASSNFFIKYFSLVQMITKSGVNIEKSDDILDVWVNRSTYYVALMQQFADAYFTPKTGVKVRLSLLPDESKLTYSYAAGTQPDAALGVSPSVPYDLGIRGALLDLHEQPGFSKVIQDFAPGALLNQVVGDKVYGLPETQDFQVTFYRTDLLQELGIEVPNTYDEIIEILPNLQRYGMNYYLPLSSGAGLKSISNTAPFIYQHGGDIYSEDYLSSAIDSKEAIEAINLMVDLFAIYSLPLTAQNFYDSFRNGTIPIGVAGFDVYLQIANAAPEIEGKWAIALHPGVEQSDGSINRTATGVGRSAVIFNKSKKQSEAWDFLSWWLSAEIQSKFSNDIQATYGPTFLWNTANLKAFEDIAIEEEHKEVILEQWEQLRQIPNIPATYILERGISDIWNKAVFDQVSVRSAITDMTIEMNKEITRKMVEFKYLDSQGNILIPYQVPSIDDIIRWQKGE